MEFTARRYDTGQVVTVSIDDGRIDSITHADGPDSQNVPWVSPGFVDLQINGYGGQEFNDLALDTERVAQVSLANDADGVTSYLPTLTTQSSEMLCHGMQAIAKACEEDPRVAKRVIGMAPVGLTPRNIAELPTGMNSSSSRQQPKGTFDSSPSLPSSKTQPR